MLWGGFLAQKEQELANGIVDHLAVRSQLHAGFWSGWGLRCA